MQVAGPQHNRRSKLTRIAAPPHRLAEFLSWTCSFPPKRKAASKALVGRQNLGAGVGAVRRPSAERGPEELNPRLATL